MDASFLEVFKIRLDGALSNVVESLLMAEGLELHDLSGPFHPNHSMVS